jgi:type IV pilus assembly protein PilA
MQKQRGFSLIELLIVIAIILVIAAIAIPNLLEARKSANEASAVGSIREIKVAEFAYYTSYPTVGFAAALGDLGGTSPCTPSSATGCLLDNFLATATPGGTGKSGYYFLATGVNSGGTLNSAFSIGGAPIEYRRTGNRNFCSTNDGVLRSQPGSAGTLPVSDVPSCQAFPVAQ